MLEDSWAWRDVTLKYYKRSAGFLTNELQEIAKQTGDMRSAQTALDAATFIQHLVTCIGEVYSMTSEELRRKADFLDGIG